VRLAGSQTVWIRARRYTNVCRSFRADCTRIQYPGFRFAPPWAEVSYAFGVFAKNLVVPRSRSAFDYAKHVQAVRETFGLLINRANLLLCFCEDDRRSTGFALQASQSRSRAARDETARFYQPLLRHLKNEKLMRKVTLNQKEAWKCHDSLRQDGRVVFADEPPDLEDWWRQLTRYRQPRYRLWTDAYLAAFALSPRLPLSTLDRDFPQFSGLTLDLVDKPDG